MSGFNQTFKRDLNEIPNMDRFKKIFTISIMMVTVLAMSIVVAPSVDAAASAGDLIKMDGMSSVYYLGADGNRYVFPNEATYFSWYSDFSTVVTVSQSEIETYALKANVTIRPGTKLVTSPSNSKVYAVSEDGVLRYIASEEAAISLWGTDWATMVVDVVDSFFTNYTVGTALPVGEYPSGQLFKTASGSDVFYMAADGTARKVADESAFAANRFSWDYIATAPGTYTMPTAGTDVTGMEDGLKDTSQGGGSTGGVVKTGAGVTAALSSATPASQSVPNNASVDFLKFNLTSATAGETVVSSITFEAIGLGDSGDIESVVIYSDSVRIAKAKNVNSDGVVTINLTRPMTIAAGETKTFTVRATILNTKTGQYGLSIVSASNILANGTVAGAFPINGNIMSGADSVDLGAIAVEDGGSLSEITLGDEAAKLANMKLTASNEDIALTAITLKRETTDAISDTDIENITLSVDGTVIATADAMVDKKISFVFENSYSLAKSKSKKFIVKADIIGGAGKKIQLKLDDTSDIIGVGEKKGYPVKVTGSYTVATALTVKAGKVALVKTQPAKTEVKKNTDNVSLGAISIEPQTAMQTEIVDVSVIITGTGDDEASSTAVAWNKLDTVKLVDAISGISYDLAYVSGTSAKTYKVTDMGIIIPVNGEKKYEVQIDIADSATDQTYELSYNAGITLKEVGGDEVSITDITPTTLDFKKVSITASSLDVSKSALSGTFTRVGGTKNIQAMAFNLEANDIDSVKVTELVFKDTNSAITTDIISDFRITDASGEPIANETSIATYGVTFDGLEIVIPAGETKKFFLVVDTLAIASGTDMRFSMSGATAEDSEDAETVVVKNNGTAVSTSNLASGRNIIVVSKGMLTVSVDNTIEEVKRDSYVVAGTNSSELVAIKFKATNEEVKITELVVTSSAATIDTNVNTFELLNEARTVIATAANVANETTFKNLSLIIEPGSETYYLRAILNKIGLDEPGALNLSSDFAIKGIKAEGKDELGANDTDTTCEAGEICYLDASGSVVNGSATQVTAVSKIVGIVGSRVSNIEFVADYDGTEVASLLTGGSNNIAIIKVTTDSSLNTDTDGDAMKTLIESIKVKIVTTEATLAGITIEKIGSEDLTASTSVATEYARFAMSGEGAKVANAETVYFVIKATVTLTGSSDHDSTIQVNLDKLNGDDADNNANGGNVSWKESHSSANAKNQLRLSKSKIDGTKITD